MPCLLRKAGLGLFFAALLGPVSADCLTGCCPVPSLRSSDGGNPNQAAESTPSPTPNPASSEAVSKSEQPYPKFSHGGQMQVQFDAGSLGSTRPTAPFPSANGLAPYAADSHLFIRRLRPSFQVELSPQWEFTTEFDIKPENESLKILDFRFNYQIGQQTALSMGRYKVPFGWEGLRSSRTTNTIERSDMTVALYPERDIGVSVTHQQANWGELSVGTFLGRPRGQGGINNHFDTIGRAVFDIDDKLKLGLSGHLGTYRAEGSSADLPVRRLGTELQYESGPLRVEAEAIYSDGYNLSSGIDSEALGFYTTLIYQLSDSLDLVLNYDRFDPALDSDSALAPTQTQARDRKVIGINYYFNRAQTHRIMLNYEIKRELEGVGFERDGVRVRYQIAW